MATLVQLMDRGHRGMESNLIVQPKNIVFGHIHDRPVVSVERVGVRDNRVQVIVATCELQNDDYRFFFLYSDV